jgi:3-dehydroquinate synthase II
MKFAWIMAEGNVWDKKSNSSPPPGIRMDHIVDFTDADNIRRLGNVKLISDSKALILY